MGDIVRIVEVKIGKNKYHLIFKGYIPRKDPNRKYEFDFIGTELQVDETYLPDKAKNDLRKKFLKDFGYPPYNEDKAKKILGNMKDYTINLF